jgi:hypothetical protein
LQGIPLPARSSGGPLEGEETTGDDETGDEEAGNEEADEEMAGGDPAEQAAEKSATRTIRPRGRRKRMRANLKH